MGEDCVLEKQIVLFFVVVLGGLCVFFKELENCAEIESTSLFILAVGLENFSFPVRSQRLSGV